MAKRKAKRKKPGAHTKLTEELIVKLAKVYRRNMNAAEAAEACGISRRTIYGWLNPEECRGSLHEKLREAFEAATELWEADRNSRIADAEHEDWRAAAWRLERRMPAKYAPRQRIEMGMLDAAIDEQLARVAGRGEASPTLPPEQDSESATPGAGNEGSPEGTADRSIEPGLDGVHGEPRPLEESAAPGDFG